MASKTDIANLALIKLGQNSISNVDTENTKTARVISSVWDIIRDAVLQAYPWHFARKRIQLAPVGIAPVYGWSYAYNLPSDFLNVIMIGDDSNFYNSIAPYYDVNGTNIYDTTSYTLENGQILTNNGPVLNITYTARKENTGDYPAVFVEALSTRLAVEICEAITQSNTRRQTLMVEYDNVLRTAQRTDSVDDPINYLPDGSYVLVRY